MKKVLAVAVLFLVTLNVSAIVILPKGGKDNSIVCKDGDEDPRNNYHFKFLKTEPDSFIGSDKEGLTTFYKMDEFAPIAHFHETSDINGLEDVLIDNAKHATEAIRAINADFADEAEKAYDAKHADKADFAVKADYASNGLDPNAPVGTSPIKVVGGYSYAKAGLPRGGAVGQILYKYSNNDYDFAFANASPLPKTQIANSVYFIDADGNCEWMTQADYLQPYEDEIHTYKWMVWVALGLGIASLIFFIVSLIMIKHE